jgi:hypothetical protein
LNGTPSEIVLHQPTRRSATADECRTCGDIVPTVEFNRLLKIPLEKRARAINEALNNILAGPGEKIEFL